MRYARRTFLLSAPAGCIAMASCGPSARSTDIEPSAGLPSGESTIEFPRQPAELVRQTVGASHRDIDQVRRLIDRHPSLVNAAWDWGFGDWETALGAAAHTGRAAIAELLLERGARMDIFAAAMLGLTEVVRGMIQATPGLERSRGPHGILLLDHARAGGVRALSTVEYLQSLQIGDSPKSKGDEGTGQLEGYAGTYNGRVGRRDCVAVVQVNRNNDLTVTFERHTPIVLRRSGADTFHPAGAWSVVFTFLREGGRVTGLTVTDHEPVFQGSRSG